MSAAGAIRLIAARELRERLRTRAYVFSTGALIVLMGLGLVLPRVVSVRETTYGYGVAGPHPARLEAALARAAAARDVHISVRAFATVGAARRAVDRGSVAAVLDANGRTIVFRREVDRTMVAVAAQAFAALELPARLHRTGVTRAQLAELTAAPRMQVHTLHPSSGVSERTARLIALGGASLMLMAISIYGSWVMAGVAQEKTGRVAELLVAAIPPRHLLAGKVVGIGLLGLGQVAVVAGVFAGATAVGATPLPVSFISGAALVVVWFVIGFALYSVGFAVAGAVVSRQEDVATVSIPVTGVMVVSFFVSYGALQADPGGLLTQVATVFPTTAPFMIPGRSAVSGVPIWEHALALLTTAAALVGFVRLGGRLYAAALLHTSPLAGLGAAWRLRGG